ncbi:ribbon-helix-helix protein, CopG family [Candidatus Daviesbacteria bacterium]|nr:ribbon-helix-helix protein, CopG family [Candidatus Daviesbacteria bacterium]
MYRISVYIPEETKKIINLAARAKSKAESEIIRDALKEGLKKIYRPAASAQALLDLAKMAENLPTKRGSPTNVSINHDYYAWGGEKRKR